MKLLIAGSDEVWSIERYYAKYLEAEGIEIEICPVQSFFYSYYNNSLLHKLLYRSGLSGIDARIDKRMRAFVSEWKPDVIWVFKGMEISPALLEWARTMGIKLVNYNPDNPFLFSGKGSGNKNVTGSIGLYDLHFTYDRKIQDRIIRDYRIACKILPFGFELSGDTYSKCILQQEVIKTCFLGNPDAPRAAFLSEIADDFPVDVYGDGWDKFVNHENITIHPPVYGDEFWITLRKYRAQLNLMRAHNPLSHNMRSFEIPGVGGIGVFPATEDHALSFCEGTELFLYRDMAACKEVLSRILNMNEEQAAGVRKAARKKSLDAGYTYHGRAIQAIQGIREIV